VDLCWWVGGAEFCGEVGEVGEGEFSGVGFLRDANVDYVLLDEVAGEGLACARIYLV
jgi:hypothetical protein